MMRAGSRTYPSSDKADLATDPQHTHTHNDMEHDTRKHVSEWTQQHAQAIEAEK